MLKKILGIESTRETTQHPPLKKRRGKKRYTYTGIVPSYTVKIYRIDG